MEDLLRQGIRAQVLQSAENLASIAANEGLIETIGAVARECVGALRNGKKVLFAGNGGSAADSQHLAAELVNRFQYDRPGLCAFALTTDTSVLTAIGNDYGIEHIFARQVEAVGASGDVFIGISTSGRSPNVLNAMRVARSKGLVTVGFTGRDGNELMALCHHCVRVPSSSTPRIQEGHILIGHIICQLIEAEIFPRP